MIDVELLQGMAAFLTPIAVDDGSLGLEAIRDVGPGGNFFGTAHTLERYETAFHEPILSDWRNYETWAEDGSRTVLERANKLYLKLLENYAPRPLDVAIDEVLREFVERRRQEISSG
jgi:trimethylamine--corrinoid protein Co-methyltransferase